MVKRVASTNVKGCKLGQNIHHMDLENEKTYGHEFLTELAVVCKVKR